MLTLFCFENHLNIFRINIIILFSCLLLLGFQCLADFLKNDIYDIENIKSYSIVLILVSIIFILGACITYEENPKNIESLPLFNNEVRNI
jgi:hypothetical protein